jgi:acyl carrier protein
MTKREQIREFLSGLLRSQSDTQPFDDSTSLLLSGRLSSLDLVEILAFLGEKFGFTVPPSQFDQSRFDSVDNILAMVEGKTK